MKRSNEPIFCAGGMLSALVAPVLILVTGIAVPLGWWLPAHTLNYERVSAFVGHPLGALLLLVVISLFLFHGCHRLLHALHDLGVHAGRMGPWLFYGFATLGTIATAAVLGPIVF
jgi:fumarate reductase subunit D